MSTFAQLFDPQRGDLVYGRSEERERYSSRLPPATQKTLDACYWMVDDYNDAAGVSMARLDGAPPGSPIGDDPSQIPRREDRAYLGAFKQSRFTPDAIRNVPRDALLAKAQPRPTLPNPARFAELHASTRRACKFGIEYVLDHLPPGGLVHFILDGLGNELIKIESEYPPAVKRKKVYVQGGYQSRHVPITTSELLSVYRNWDRYRGSVLFYRNFACINPPWEQETDEVPSRTTWRCYARARVDKYRAKLADGKAHGAHARSRREEVDALEALAAAAHDGGDFNLEANYLKEAYHWATRGEPWIGPALYRPPSTLGQQPTGAVGNCGKTLVVHVHQALESYQGRKGGIRVLQWRSHESKAALDALQPLVARGEHEALLRAVQHYLGIANAPALSPKLATGSSLHAELQREYRLWRFGEGAAPVSSSSSVPSVSELYASEDD
jgi:hypothetical protein